MRWTHGYGNLQHLSKFHAVIMMGEKLPMDHRIQILFQDQALIAVNKPAQVLVIPDRWDPDQPNLLAMLKREHPTEPLYVVHRLDEGTSGLVLLARTAEAHRQLNQQWQERRVRKTYLAVVIGEISDAAGTIDLPIAASSQKGGRMAVHARGKASITHYEVIQRFRGYTSLKLQPATGRTHQIRVHLKAIGHPLAVDPLYGGEPAIFLSRLKPRYKPKADEPERPLIQRLTLHALEIRFQHPITQAEITIAAEIPKDLRALLHALEKYRRQR